MEFAIGTGRIALPLAERGVRVAGIDNSEPMPARLRAKPGAERIEVIAGDMASTRVERAFSLVYLIFNTIFNLTTRGSRDGGLRINRAQGAASARRCCAGGTR